MTNNQTDGLTITVTGISTTGESGTVEVGVCISDSEHEERKSFILLPDIFMQIGIKKGLISRETFGFLERSGDFSFATLKGMALIAHGDHSTKAMIRNLMQKGIEKKYAEQAAKYLKCKGYIDENQSAMRVAANCTAKLWGLNRIVTKLYADGYCDKAVKAAVDSLSEYDFVDACKTYIRKKYKVLPSEREKVIKIMNSLRNYGYTPEQIKQAVNEIK